ncbi:hypothetical protein U1701_17380 [Sphingomonas sp. PB2P19]|uniref:VgrG-related protein n=1 Tax=Sphingomonas rhamnosi TaxID=3096156 RepID=UPI002FCA5B97
MNRKPIFDAVRILLGRGFTPSEVKSLDLACDLAEAALSPAAPPAPVENTTRAPASPVPHVAARSLGSLSEEFESGGRGPETVSGGLNDPGGVSYGVYQLASKSGSCAAFMKVEGRPWAADFGTAVPGSLPFTTASKAVAHRDPDAFRKAQHAFIERTHYRPVLAAVTDRKGIDLDARSDAVSDVAWSCAVQHAGAPNILIEAIDVTDRNTARDDPAYDRQLIEATYATRKAYVLHVASNPKLAPGERAQLISITKNRYPKELAKALAILGTGASLARSPAQPAIGGAAANGTPGAILGTINGRAVAGSNGVDVKGPSVNLDTLDARMEPAIVAVAQSARALALPRPVITSGNDSKHMDGSRHYTNRAIDFRGNNVKVSVGQALRDLVAAKLGTDYDVAFETFMDPANNHLHVEYDPD